VLIHIDAEQGGENLVNRRLAYVAVSRGRYDAQIYTNDKTALAEGLGRDVSHRSALESTRAAEPRVAQRTEPPPSLTLRRTSEQSSAISAQAVMHTPIYGLRKSHRMRGG
jgi:hypothetical protein